MSVMMVTADTSGRTIETRLRRARLVSIDNTLLALLFEASDMHTTLGRARDAMIRLIADPYVSAYHAVIEWDGLLKSHVIMDCDSRNGTFVDDVRVTSPIRLVDGARIRIGTTELEYHSSRRVSTHEFRF